MNEASLACTESLEKSRMPRVTARPISTAARGTSSIASRTRAGSSSTRTPSRGRPTANPNTPTHEPTRTANSGTTSGASPVSSKTAANAFPTFPLNSHWHSSVPSCSAPAIPAISSRPVQRFRHHRRPRCGKWSRLHWNREQPWFHEPSTSPNSFRTSRRCRTIPKLTVTSHRPTNIIATVFALRVVAKWSLVS